VNPFRRWSGNLRNACPMERSVTMSRTFVLVESAVPERFSIVGCCSFGIQRAWNPSGSMNEARGSLYRFAAAPSHLRSNMASYAARFHAGPELDIGAGWGSFVEALHRRGNECIGLISAKTQARPLAASE
jgi:hypothetical protein